MRWDFRLALSRFWRICRRLRVWPTLDAFASSWSHQIPRYMTWEEDSRAMAINALDYYWDPVTWLFPLVPLIPLALERVSEQQIEAILICPGWKGAMWCLQIADSEVFNIGHVPPVLYRFLIIFTTSGNEATCGFILNPLQNLWNRRHPDP